MGVAGGDAVVSEEFLSHYAAFAHRVYDLDAGAVAIGVEFSAYERGGSYSGKRARSQSLYLLGILQRKLG